MKQLRMILLAVALLAPIVSGGVSGWVFYNKGVTAEKARQAEKLRATQKELFKAGEDLSLKALQLEAANKERDALAIDLENMALDAPGASNPGIGSNGLRRLGKRWGSP